jgi:hypothetical protein
MKLRRLSLVLALVLLAAFLVVAPVQAGRTVKPVTFCWTELTTWDWQERGVGATLHVDWLLEGPLASDDDSRVCGFLSWTQEISVVFNPELFWWGPITGHWRMVVPQADGSLAGWEGVSRVHPQQDPIKWPKAWVARGTGNGFGRYKNMRIEWTVMGVPPTCEEGVIFSGQITENSP